MLKSNPRSPETKSFFKRPTGIVVGILSAIVLILVVLSVVNYLISSRGKTNFYYSHMDDNTLIFVSAQFRGDFWNFAKDEYNKVSAYAPESRIYYILSRSGSTWELEQEISRDKPVDGVSLNFDYATIYYAAIPKGDTLLLGNTDIIYILRRNGSTWELEQEISEDKPVDGVSLDNVSDIQFQGDTLLLQARDNAIYILSRNGSTWELEQEISDDQPVDGVSLAGSYYSDIQFQGDTLLLQVGDNAIYILRRNGSTWELEQEISDDQPVDGVSLAGSYYSDIQFQGDTLLLQVGDNAIYILRRNGSTWELEQEISDDQPVDGVSLDNVRNVQFQGDTLLLQVGDDNVYILGRNGSTWELEQEISDDQPVDGVSLAGSYYSDIRLQDDALLLQDSSTVYILRRNGSTWELEQKILLENLL